MSNQFAPQVGIPGTGILANRPDNPFEGWNHAFVYYCSSDSWSGQQTGITVSAPHPVAGGEPIPFRLRFGGARIVEAVVRTLRRDGVGPVSYTTDAGTSVELPDLDDATTVVLAGGSAGGGGTINNLDWLNEHLRTHNVGCAGPDCALSVRGIIDSIYAPDFRDLGFANTTMCVEDGVCSAEALMTRQWTERDQGLWQARGDESCPAWHASRGTDEEFWCAHLTYVVENHLTTPFIVRMGLTDSLISSNMIETGFTVPSMGDATITLASFAALTAAQLEALPAQVSAGNEAGAITVAPGVFGPICAAHETLGNNAAFYDTTVGDPAVSFPQLLNNWWTQSGTTVVVSSSQAELASCP